MRLIDADALKEKITVSALGGHKRYYVWTLIDECPTIEAEPVKRGKWVEKPTIAYCSVCHVHWTKSFIVSLRSTYNYCPNCGARMRGDEK